MVSAVKDAGARVGFTTNATLLDGDRRDRVLASGLDILGVSLAGTTAKTHARYRSGCDLEAVKANLRALAGRRSTRDRPEIHLAFLLVRGNRHELPALPALAEALGASQVVVSQLSLLTSPANEDESTLSHPDLWETTADTLAAAREDAARRGIDLRCSVPSEERLPVCGENVLRSCFIAWNGTVTPCVMCNVDPAGDGPARHLYRGAWHELRGLDLGSLRDASLEEIWRSPAARSFREAVRERAILGTTDEEGLPERCRSCWKMHLG
jgi:MoaA/NifB/PqqE/SkfB family radical SAM enzyme